MTKIEKPPVPWREILDVIVMGLLGGIVILSLAWGIFKVHFPLESVIQ